MVVNETLNPNGWDYVDSEDADDAAETAKQSAAFIRRYVKRCDVVTKLHDMALAAAKHRIDAQHTAIAKRVSDMQNLLSLLGDAVPLTRRFGSDVRKLCEDIGGGGLNVDPVLAVKGLESYAALFELAERITPLHDRLTNEDENYWSIEWLSGYDGDATMERLASRTDAATPSLDDLPAYCGLYGALKYYTDPDYLEMLIDEHRPYED